MKPLSSFKPQAVFSDIDGTLLTSEHVVSPLTSSAIHTQNILYEKGISISDASKIIDVIEKNVLT